MLKYQNISQISKLISPSIKQRNVLAAQIVTTNRKFHHVITNKYANDLLRYIPKCGHQFHLHQQNTIISRSLNRKAEDIPIKYKVAILEEFNKPMIITNVKNDTPLGTDMIRIGVQFCSLNITDVNKLAGIFPSGDEVLLPTIPGCEFSGEILEVGDYVTENLKIGDKVVAYLDPNHQIGGGLAEQAVVSELDCFPTSDISQKHAALLINGHGSALLAFTKYCELNENDIVIVIAGSGGNGLAAIQLAKNVFKAKVYVIADTEDTSAIIRAEGAHKSISVGKDLSKITKFLESSLKGGKAKAVYDAVGGGLMYLTADFVDPVNGCFFTVDPAFDFHKFPESKPEFLKKTKSKSKQSKENNEKADSDDENDNNKDDDLDEFVRKIKKIDLFKYREMDKDFYRQIISDTMSLCEQEIIVPYVSQTFGLYEINKAIEYIRAKKCTGKVLIDIRKKDNDEKNNENDKK